MKCLLHKPVVADQHDRCFGTPCLAAPFNHFVFPDESAIVPETDPRKPIVPETVYPSNAESQSSSGGFVFGAATANACLRMESKTD